METINDIKKITDSLYKHTEEILKEFITKNKTNIACKKGCSICCRTLRVELFPTEAFIIAENIKKKFSEKEINKLKIKLKINAEKTKGKNILEHIEERIECIFLNNNECSIYDFRPFKCRTFLSKDFYDCLIKNCKIELIPELEIQVNKLSIKYFKTINNSNLDYTPVEINDALYKILSNNNLIQKYFNKEKGLFNPLNYLNTK